MKISVVIPTYNSEATIARLCEEVFMQLSGHDVEIVLVNDCSKDGTEEVCAKLALHDHRIVFASHRRNFGEHNTVLKGLSLSTGDVAAIIDDDFQNPPSEIIKLVAEFQKGYDVVFARYAEKKHSTYRNLGSKFNDLMAHWALGKPRNLYLASFKLISRPVIDQIVKYKGPFVYIDGLVLRTTRNVSSALVEHKEREEGRSNYNVRRLFSLFLNMFLGFSTLPMWPFTIFGLGLITISLLGFFISLSLILMGITIPYTSTVLSLLLVFVSGVQVSFLGLIGEYIGRIYLTLNDTPQSIVKFVIKNKVKTDA